MVHCPFVFILFFLSGLHLSIHSYLLYPSIRIASSDAAQYIQSAYDKREEPVLLITSDASRGANRFTGLASILRFIPASSSSSTRDTVCVCTRRIQSPQSYDIVSSELAAILLGLKVAKTTFHPIPNLLLLTDCEGALSQLESMFQQDSTLVYDTTLGWKESMSGTSSCQIHVAKVRSAHSREGGFFDHEAADILSSKTRTIANSYWKKKDKGEGDGNNRVEKEYHDTRILVPMLQPADLLYLSTSESMDTSTSRIQSPVQRKKESGARRQRCELRMATDWKLDRFPISTNG
jgi:hypothetical protein